MAECSVCRSRLVSPSSKAISRAYDSYNYKIRVSSKQRALNVFLVVGDCMLVGLQPVLVYMSKVDGKFNFSPISVNFLTEIAKVIFAIVMLLFQARHQKVGEKPLLSLSTFVQAARNNVLLAVPAGLYAINNYLKFTMQFHIAILFSAVPAIFQSCYCEDAKQSKSFGDCCTTEDDNEAKVFHHTGISINQLRSLPEGATTMAVPIATGAYICTFIFRLTQHIIMQVTVPSLASVYNEYALKSQFDTSIYLQLAVFDTELFARVVELALFVGLVSSVSNVVVLDHDPLLRSDCKTLISLVQNLFLYGYGAIFNFLGILGTVIYKGPGSFDILQGHSRATMFLILNNAAQGILSSFFFKYADTILKKYSSTVATIFTGIASAALFGHILTMNFLLGISIVFISMHQFFSPLSKAKDEQQNGNLELVDAKDGHRAKDSFINMAAGANEESTSEKHDTMNMTSCSSSSSSSFPRLFAAKSQIYKAPLVSFSTPKRRRPRPRRNRKSNGLSYDHSNGNLLSISTSSPAGADDQSLSLTLDVHRISTLANTRFQLFLDSSKDAFSDLQTLIALDDNRRVVVSCKKSTMQFVGGVVILGFVFGFAIRVLVKLGSALKGNFQSNPKFVVRRDRSLGGKEVVVSVDNIRSSSRDSKSSIASDQVSRSNSIPRNLHLKAQDNLPKWWPTSLPSQNFDVVDKEDYQREANRIVRAPWESSSVEICSEDAREFIAGLAENIGLAKIDAARMVSAAVAARTRSWFLQAWAEMEMVARGLEKLMKLEERQSLLKTFVGICSSEDSQRSAAEALGLVHW
ncbi:hypothetical protein ARALYDRAFT_322000 [Arabidopsis lyrata subsp. lyrata]|uniref:Uncharacterized protein n=2 Tax=Magnoliopsida TaxID=3398 RepID=D7LJZ2_ARALL|nr:hypothetical protein ARALYDRAFT_322000 [Arabidopsis lyrata subsp. lyrata]